MFMLTSLAGGWRVGGDGADEGRLRDAGDEFVGVDPEQVWSAQRPPLPQQSRRCPARSAQVQKLPYC